MGSQLPSKGISGFLCPDCLRPHRANESHVPGPTWASGWPGAISMGDHANGMGCEQWAMGLRWFWWSVFLFTGVHQIEDSWRVASYHPQSCYLGDWAVVAFIFTGLFGDSNLFRSTYIDNMTIIYGTFWVFFEIMLNYFPKSRVWNPNPWYNRDLPVANRDFGI